MKIAICDDCPAELTRLSSLLEVYRQERRASLTFHPFASPVELLEAMRVQAFDLLFLDVMMPELSGLQAARELRQFDRDVKLVFLTSSPDFAVESYAVRAYDYLLKPVEKATLFALLDRCAFDTQQQEAYLAVKCKTGMVRVVYACLSYVEVMGKTLSFHMNNGTVYQTAAPLTDYQSTFLARPEFMQVHRAFVVNLWQMRELTPREFVTLAGERIPVSRRLHPRVRDAYLKSLFSKKEGD